MHEEFIEQAAKEIKRLEEVIKGVEHYLPETEYRKGETECFLKARGSLTISKLNKKIDKIKVQLADKVLEKWAQR